MIPLRLKIAWTRHRTRVASKYVRGTKWGADEYISGQRYNFGYYMDGKRVG